MRITRRNEAVVTVYASSYLMWSTLTTRLHFVGDESPFLWAFSETDNFSINDKDGIRANLDLFHLDTSNNRSEYECIQRFGKFDNFGIDYNSE